MFARSFSRVFKFKTAVRKMAGDHHPPAPQGGLDGIVRKYLPGDHHVSMAILGLYFSLYMVSKLLPSKKKAPAAAEPAHAHSTHSSGEVPAVDSPDFEKWISTPGNIEKVLEAL